MVKLISYNWFFCVMAIMLVGIPVRGNTAEDGPPDCQAQPEKPASLSSYAEKLLSALTTKTKEREVRFRRLRELISHGPENRSAAEDWLRQKALLMVAAYDLEEGKLARARRRLRGIPVDSPAAVDAALLLADSFRMAGRPDKARQWYLRVGKRFPQERTALKGVLAASARMEARAPEVAVTLYDDVSAKAENAAERLESIRPQLKDQKLRWLFASASDPGLRRQMLERLARQPGPNALGLKRKEVASTTRIQCLLRASRPLYRAQTRLQGRMDRLNRQRLQARQSIRTLASRKASLEERIERGRLTPEQKQIRKKVMQIGNTLERKKAHLDFVRRNRERLPRLIGKLENRIQRLYEQFRAQQELSSRALSQELRQALKNLRGDFLDVAATADHRKARVLEEKRATPEQETR